MSGENGVERPSPSWPRPALLTLGAVAVAAGLLGGGFLVGRLAVSPPADGGGTETETTVGEPELSIYRDAEAGFSIAHPAHWSPLEPADPEVRLLVTPDGANSLLVRVIELGSEAPDGFPALRSLTEEVIAGSDTVQNVTGPDEVVLSGLPGYHYAYTFLDGASARRGVHSHYFLVSGSRMYVLVFQALPEEEFDRLAPLFDTIAQTFQIHDG